MGGRVGAGVGSGVGLPLGAGVGGSVGLPLGSGVGGSVGTGDGCRDMVGAGVGTGVGLPVGSGVTDGAMVGAAVGSGVGTWPTKGRVDRAGSRGVTKEGGRGWQGQVEVRTGEGTWDGAEVGAAVTGSQSFSQTPGQSQMYESSPSPVSKASTRSTKSSVVCGGRLFPTTNEMSGTDREQRCVLLGPAAAA